MTTNDANIIEIVVYNKHNIPTNIEYLVCGKVYIVLVVRSFVRSFNLVNITKPFIQTKVFLKVRIKHLLECLTKLSRRDCDC